MENLKLKTLPKKILVSVAMVATILVFNVKTYAATEIKWQPMTRYEETVEEPKNNILEQQKKILDKGNNEEKTQKQQEELLMVIKQLLQKQQELEKKINEYEKREKERESKTISEAVEPAETLQTLEPPKTHEDTKTPEVVEVEELVKIEKQEKQDIMTPIIIEEKEQPIIYRYTETLPPIVEVNYANQTKKNNFESIQSAIQDASVDASIVEAKAGFIYNDGAIYKIYCSPGYITDIQLQQGETVTYVAGGDTSRWILDNGTSGANDSTINHIYVKPMRDNLSTNLVINTDKHSYQLQLISTATTYNPIINWLYPAENKINIMKSFNNNSKININAMNLDELNFNYNISGKNYAWKPYRAFDDGKKTYIEVNPEMKNREAPVVYVKLSGKLAMVNYRYKDKYIIIDKLFDEAIIINGKEKIKIKRGD